MNLSLSLMIAGGRPFNDNIVVSANEAPDTAAAVMAQWTPADLGAALFDDWDADNSTVSTGKVTAVADSGTQNHPLTDAGNAPQRPTFNASGPNGHAEITFDGVAMALESGNFTIVALPFTIVCVCKQYGQLSAGSIWSDGGGTTVQFNENTPQMNMFGGAANNVVSGTVPNLDPDYGVMLWEKKATGAPDWYNNGSLLTNNGTDPGHAAGIDSINLGAYQFFPFSSSFLHCSITRFMVIDGAVSSTNRGYLTTYLKNRYGIS